MRLVCFCTWCHCVVVSPATVSALRRFETTPPPSWLRVKRGRGRPSDLTVLLPRGRTADNPTLTSDKIPSVLQLSAPYEHFFFFFFFLKHKRLASGVITGVITTNHCHSKKFSLCCVEGDFISRRGSYYSSPAASPEWRFQCYHDCNKLPEWSK